jgi:hypothetical protein
MTTAEFKRMLGLKESNLNKKYTLLSEEGLEDSVDWRTKGAVTPVKN